MKKPTIDTEKFYNLMQEYRHAPMTDQRKVIEAYTAVINYIEKHYYDSNNRYERKRAT